MFTFFQNFLYDEQVFGGTLVTVAFVLFFVWFIWREL